MSFSTSGRGTGIVPEDHPSAWFAVIKGRKRWAFHPPNRLRLPNHWAGVFTERGQGSCAIPQLYTSTVLCDQPPGSIVWTPPGWYHETCTLDDFTIGIGALSCERRTSSTARATAHTVLHYKLTLLPMLLR